MGWMSRRGWWQGVVVATLLGGVKSALASGFALIEQSGSGLGNAYAGGAAVAEDAATLFYNPAGLTRLPAAQLVTTGHLISPSTRFRDGGSAINPRFTGGEVVAGTLYGSDGGEGGEAGAIPNLYYARPVGEEWAWGIGIYVPFGLGTDYERDWVGRYHAIKSQIHTVNIAPALAWRLDQQWSVGASLSAQYIEGELTQAVDLGAMAAALGMATAPANPATDGVSRMTGESWSWGYSVGLLWEPDPGLRLGLAWRSGYDQRLEGERELQVPPSLAGIVASSRIDASATVHLPPSLSLSLYRQCGPWSLMGDVTWTGWGRFQTLVVEGEDGSRHVQQERWEDTMRYSLGVGFATSDTLLLRAGVAYDQSPVASAELRTPRIPDSDRTWLALGLSWQATPGLRLDAGYTHILVADTSIRNHDSTTGHLLLGEFQSDVDVLGLQLTWRLD